MSKRWNLRLCSFWEKQGHSNLGQGQSGRDVRSESNPAEDLLNIQIGNASKSDSVIIKEMPQKTQKVQDAFKPAGGWFFMTGSDVRAALLKECTAFSNIQPLPGMFCLDWAQTVSGVSMSGSGPDSATHAPSDPQGPPGPEYSSALRLRCSSVNEQNTQKQSGFRRR